MPYLPRKLSTKKPTEASVPNDPSARVILVMRELMTIKKENVEAWLTYMQRLPMELQALFAVNIMASERKSMFATNKVFTDWAVKHNQFFLRRVKMKIDILDDQRFDRECDFMQDKGFTLFDKDRDTCWIPPHNFTEKEQEDIEQEVKRNCVVPVPDCMGLKNMQT